MNVAQASIGSYFLLGSGDGFVYEKIGDNGTPEDPKPVIYKYKWNGKFVESVGPCPDVAVYPVALVLEDPELVLSGFDSADVGDFFLRDTDPEHYYQFFSGEFEGSYIAFRFCRNNSEYIDVVNIPSTELVRLVIERFVIARKVV